MVFFFQLLEALSEIESMLTMRRQITTDISILELSKKVALLLVEDVKAIILNAGDCWLLGTD